MEFGDCCHSERLGRGSWGRAKVGFDMILCPPACSNTATRGCSNTPRFYNLSTQPRNKPCQEQNEAVSIGGTPLPALFGCILEETGHAARPNVAGRRKAVGYAADGASGDPGCHHGSLPATAAGQQHHYMV